MQGVIWQMLISIRTKSVPPKRGQNMWRMISVSVMVNRMIRVYEKVNPQNTSFFRLH